MITRQEALATRGGPVPKTLDTASLPLLQAAYLLQEIEAGSLRPNRGDVTGTLFARAKANDQRAIALLVKQNAGLIGFAIRRWFHSQVVKYQCREDAFSAGQDGIMRALADFDESRGLKFSTYALPWVRSKIQRYLEKEIREPARRSSIQLNHEDDEYRAYELVDPVGEEEMTESLHQDKRTLLVRAAFERVIATKKKTKAEQMRVVLQQRFYDEKPLSEVGKEMGVSREWVRLLEKELFDGVAALINQQDTLPSPLKVPS
jgi:RNA polymerase sigma factor (sigma-70 family)